MGTPDFAVPVLDALVAAGHHIACTYSQPPRPAGRGMAERASPVHQRALSLGLEVRTPSSLKTLEAQAAFADLQTDAAIVVAYGLILPQAVLSAPRHGCFNVHASLLPRWRGAAPIQRAIMAGDAETGVDIMRMEAGLDTGPVCLEERIPISPYDTAASLHDRLSGLGAQLIIDALQRLESGTLVCQPQSEDGVTYAGKIAKSETHIDFARQAAAVRNHIHGLSPFPGAWFLLGKERIKVLSCEVVAASGSPGEVLGNDFTVACGSAALRFLTVQREGKGPMPVAAFLRGRPVPAGTMLG